LVVALVGGFLLFTEQRAQGLGVLPYLFLLACPFILCWACLVLLAIWMAAGLVL
jgi:hypothetical protein